MLRKKKSLKILAIAMALIIAGVIVSLRRVPGEASGGGEGDQKVVATKSTDRKPIEGQEATGTRVLTEERDRALIELKVRWQEFFDFKDGGGELKEVGRMQVQLTEESASRLLASEQAIELLILLDGMNAGSEATMLRRKIRELFTTGDADLLVGPLVDAISEIFSTVEDQYASDLMKWSLLMGTHASPEAAERFRKGVDEPWPMGDFLHGWCVSKAGVDPVGSYTLLVDFIKAGGKGSRLGQSLENVIKSFPEGQEFDYGALEAMLPTGVVGPNERVFSGARRGLFVRWSKEDPAAAANHIIDHPERVSPDLVTYVVEQAIKGDRFENIEWIKKFPDGIYYDKAAVAVVQRLWHTHPTEAKEWAMSIGDEKIRQTQLLDIETIRKRNKRRER